MKALYGDGDHWEKRAGESAGVVVEVKRSGAVWTTGLWPSNKVVPDVSDPGTLGHLMELARRAHGVQDYPEIVPGVTPDWWWWKWMDFEAEELEEVVVMALEAE